jgi:hypothetical protein
MVFVFEGRSIRFIGYGDTLYSLHSIDSLMDTLLQAYTNIFDEPSGLHPQRHHDHQIHLLPGTTPVVVQLYC